MNVSSPTGNPADRPARDIALANTTHDDLLVTMPTSIRHGRSSLNAADWCHAINTRRTHTSRYYVMTSYQVLHYEDTDELGVQLTSMAYNWFVGLDFFCQRTTEKPSQRRPVAKFYTVP